MSANDKYKHYSAADIQKYLRGDLSAREMQALEAAALEDPFLADALEGMEKDGQLRGETAFREDLAALKERLDLRIAKKNRAVVLPLYHSAWRATAAVIILLSVGAIIYRYVLNGRSSAPPLANAKAGKKEPPADRLSSGPASADSIVALPPAGPAKLSPSHEASPEYSPSQQLTLYDKKKAAVEKRGLASAPSVVSSAEAADASAGRTTQSPTTNTGHADLSLIDSTKPMDSASRGWASNQYIVGKVTDANNNRIPLITISFKGYRQAVRTDNNGLFRVQMLGSDSSTHIRIGSSGFESVDLPAYTLAERASNRGVANTIRLQPQFDGATDLAVGYSAMKKANQDKDLTTAPQNKTPGLVANSKGIVQQAVPVSGWIVYKAYLEKNKRDRSVDSTRTGTETISFIVNKKGKLSSFKIEQSLSPAHDSLLLHLIRYGSAWKSLNGNKGSAMISLSY